jgi:hypothetical protein
MAKARIRWALFALACFSLAASSCAKTNQADAHNSPETSAQAYAERRYSYDLSYSEYCRFKTATTKMLIDAVITEAAAEKQSVTVTAFTYTKETTLSAEDYAAYRQENDGPILAAEKALIAYVVNISPLGSEGAKETQSRSEEIALIQIQNAWFVTVALA